MLTIFSNTCWKNDVVQPSQHVPQDPTLVVSCQHFPGCEASHQAVERCWESNKMWQGNVFSDIKWYLWRSRQRRQRRQIIHDYAQWILRPVNCISIIIYPRLQKWGWLIHNPLIHNPLGPPFHRLTESYRPSTRYRFILQAPQRNHTTFKALISHWTMHFRSARFMLRTDNWELLISHYPFQNVLTKQHKPWYIHHPHFCQVAFLTGRWHVERLSPKTRRGAKAAYPELCLGRLIINIPLYRIWSLTIYCLTFLGIFWVFAVLESVTVSIDALVQYCLRNDTRY